MFVSDVKRKLGFLGKEGYDIFGKNKFFAPRMRWQALESIVQEVKGAAQSYETAFNDVISTVRNQENFQQVSDKKKCFCVCGSTSLQLTPIKILERFSFFVKPTPKQLLRIITTDTNIAKNQLEVVPYM